MPSPQRKYAQPDVAEADDGEAAAQPAKKPYTTPRLTCLGQLQEGDARRIAFDESGH